MADYRQTIGFTAKWCVTCNGITTHRIVEGQGCLVKICVVCEARKLHQYSEER